MKPLIFTILVVVAVILATRAYYLQKELFILQDSSMLCGKKIEYLQQELMRLNSIQADKDRILNEIEGALMELESKVDLKDLERHIPRKKWDEIGIVIDKLKAFQQERQEEKAY